MSQSFDDLPDEIWDIILTQLPNTHFESLSLVNKHLLSLTNHNRHNLTVTNPSYIIHNTLNHLINRFNNLNSLNLSQLSHQNSFLTALTEITNSSLVNTLTSLDISNHDYVPVGLLIKLGQKCSLRVLICGNFVKLCDEDLRGIAKAFPDLEEVDLSCPSFKFAFREFSVYEIMITDEGIECLASGLRNLVRINLSKNSLLTDKSMYCLSEKCVRLEEVVFVDCTLITMKGVRFMLDNSRNVRMIGMSVVSGLHGNESLFVDGHVELAHACLGKEEDVVMDVLKRPNLSIKYLNLSANSDMSDECLVKITSVCPNLNLLHVSSCSRITGSVGETLKNCREIRNLSIQDCGGVKNLGLRMESLKLEKLYMGSVQVGKWTGLREIAVR
ncbi:F-box/LRR-repeat protein 3 [Tanacetum coccineum]